jgi:hypothetical protein
MSRSESGSDVSSSSSDDSDNERSTNRDLVIPSPVELSDSEDDGVSPGQHKLAMMKQLAHKKVPPKSTSGSDEEEELVEEEDAQQSIDGQSGTSFESKSSPAMFSKITEMSTQLAEMMEMHRKQQLMSKKKTARAALSFESPSPANPANLRVHSLRQELLPILSARRRQMRISNATLLLRSRLAQQHAFSSRKSM